MFDKPSLNQQTIAETGDAGLMARAYNIGLKAVANLPHVLRVSDLIFWEKNVQLLKAALGGFQRKEERHLPQLERMVNSISAAIGEKIRTLSFKFKDGKITETELRRAIMHDFETLLDSMRPLQNKNGQLSIKGELPEHKLIELENNLSSVKVFFEIKKYEEVEGIYSFEIVVLADFSEIVSDMLRLKKWDGHFFTFKTLE